MLAEEESTIILHYVKNGINQKELNTLLFNIAIQ